jgi:hypothetical protein
VYRFTWDGSGTPQLPGHEVQHRARHVQRLLQERPEPPHGHQLQGEPDPHVGPAAPVHQRPVLVVEEENPVQVRLRRRVCVPAVRSRLIIGQELHRHRPQSRTNLPPGHPQRSNRYKIPHHYGAHPHPNDQWR